MDKQTVMLISNFFIYDPRSYLIYKMVQFGEFMLTLSIHHNIYLTRDQRYGLHNMMDIDTIGVSVPVWHLNQKTSEPGQEVFCKYLLRNPKRELPIKILKEGYLIYLPYRIPGRKQRSITNSDWMRMSQEQREAYYTAMPREMSSASLLDIKDGGSESLMYKEVNKVKSGDQYMKIVHYINFFDNSYLEENLYDIRQNDRTSTERPPDSEIGDTTSGT